MKKKIYSIIVFSALFFSGCEVEEVISPDSVYVEYTVVQAEIRPGKIFPGVRFTKTMPLGIPYDIKKAELKDVTAYIVKNEIQVIPLIYYADGLYKPRFEFYVEEGEVYEVYAESDGKFIYGKTFIPHKPVATSVNYNTNDYYFEADVETEINTVYAALWIVTGLPPAIAEDYFSVSTPSTNPGSVSAVRTGSIPEEYRTQAYAGQRYIQVFAFDQSYRKYFYSRTSGNEINDPFIQGGGAVEWNMQGDKVIGMFIGVTPGELINVN